MKLNKKIILISTFALVIFVLTVTSSLAAEDLNLTGRLSTVGEAAGFGDKAPNLATTLGQIIRGFLSLLGVVFMAYIIYGGYQWMMARGNEEQLTKAKAVIRGSIIGLIIVLAAYAITSYVILRVGAAGGYEVTTEEDIRERLPL
jgi:mannose/fructose/N-acetylgalactosamine-specific phosphotransferase system component IID